MWVQSTRPRGGLKDPVKVAAAAQIQSLAQELPYALGVALKKITSILPPPPSPSDHHLPSVFTSLTFLDST